MATRWRHYLIGFLLIAFLFPVVSVNAQFLPHGYAASKQRQDIDGNKFIDSCVSAGMSQSDTVSKYAIWRLCRNLKGYTDASYSTVNIWDSIVALYPLTGPNGGCNSFNLKNPSQYKVTWVGSPVHSDTGVVGAASAIGRTGIIPSTALTLNNTHVSAYLRTNRTNGNGEIGARNSTSQALYEVALGGQGFAGISYNSTGGSNGIVAITNTDSRGWYLTSRVSSTDLSIYKNGSGATTVNGTSGSLPSVQINIGGINNNGSDLTGGATNWALFSVGYGLSSSKTIPFYNAVQTYQIRKGRQVN